MKIPLPLTVLRSGGGYCPQLRDAEDHPVANLLPVGPDEWADEICTACNAHDQLVAALKSARNAIVATGYSALDKDAAVARINAALTAAGAQ